GPRAARPAAPPPTEPPTRAPGPGGTLRSPGQDRVPAREEDRGWGPAPAWARAPEEAPAPPRAAGARARGGPHPPAQTPPRPPQPAENPAGRAAGPPWPPNPSRLPRHANPCALSSTRMFVYK